MKILNEAKSLVITTFNAIVMVLSAIWLVAAIGWILYSMASPSFFGFWAQ